MINLIVIKSALVCSPYGILTILAFHSSLFLTEEAIAIVPLIYLIGSMHYHERWYVVCGLIDVTADYKM